MTGIRRRAGLAAAVALLSSTCPSIATAADLPSALTAQLKAAGGRGSGIAVDLTSRRTIWSRLPNTPRTPASVTKLYTTASVLLELGSTTRLSTKALRTAVIGPDGILNGSLWLKGDGDPSLGSAGIGTLADALKAAGLKAVKRNVIGDDGLFDRIRGVPSTGFGFNPDIGGSLGSLVFDHDGSAKAAANALTLALRHRGITVPVGHTSTGTSPVEAITAATTNSPRVATLIGMTNRPSDNFYAEMLLKALGAIKGGAGSTSAGLRVSKARLATLGSHPTLYDGSGLSHANKTTAADVERLLAALSTNTDFRGSLAVAGRSGTLSDRMRKGSAAGHCQAKTGTLSGVTALAGYCSVKNGGRLAFAILMNGTNAGAGRPRQDRIVQALARWRRPASWTPR